MDAERRVRLADVMAALAADPDDESAFAQLYFEYKVPIAATVRRHLREVGVSAISPDDLNGLVIDVCDIVAGLAGSWKPDGGALPWVWAHHRVRAAVCEHVGQFAEALDDEHLDLPDPAGAVVDDGRDAMAIARSATHPAVRHLVANALDHVSERDLGVWLEHMLQKTLGDPAPAHTVAAMFGLTPDNVRQIASRTHRRLGPLLAHLRGDGGPGGAGMVAA